MSNLDGLYILSQHTTLQYLADPAFPSASINLVDKDGRSAFHYACLNDDKNLLTILLADERVDIGLRTPNQDTCFHLAALYSSLQALAILKEDGRSKHFINAQNKFGETALHLCAGSGDKVGLLKERGGGREVLVRHDFGHYSFLRSTRNSPLFIERIQDCLIPPQRWGFSDDS